MMELIEIKCEKCGKDFYVYDNHVHDHMYCTMKCLESAHTDN